MGDWQPWVGRSETRHDVLTAGLVARHRATLNVAAGDDPLPGIHWCLAVPDARMDELGEDGHPRRVGLPTGKAENGRDIAGAFLPPIPLPRRMWASSAAEFVAPIAVGATIARTSTIQSVEEKTGSTGTLAFVNVAHETLANGRLAVRETQTLVYRAANSGAPPFLAPRGGAATLDAADWPEQAVVTPDEAQLFRFSAITFNTHRIHYDAPYAREVEGYAGLVVHGPLMSSLLLHFVTERFGQVARFTFRAQSPAYCGEVLTLAARRDGNAIALGAFGPDGTMAVKAEAVLAPVGSVA